MTVASSILLDVRDVGESVLSTGQDIQMLLDVKNSNEIESIQKFKHAKNLVENILSMLAYLSTVDYKSIDRHEELIDEVRKIEFTCFGLQSVLSQSLLNSNVYHAREKENQNFIKTIIKAANRIITISFVSQPITFNDGVLSKDISGGDICYSDKESCERECSEGFCYEDMDAYKKTLECPENKESFTESPYKHVENGNEGKGKVLWNKASLPVDLENIVREEMGSAWWRNMLPDEGLSDLDTDAQESKINYRTSVEDDEKKFFENDEILVARTDWSEPFVLHSPYEYESKLYHERLFNDAEHENDETKTDDEFKKIDSSFEKANIGNLKDDCETNKNEKNVLHDIIHKSGNSITDFSDSLRNDKLENIIETTSSLNYETMGTVANDEVTKETLETDSYSQHSSYKTDEDTVTVHETRESYELTTSSYDMSIEETSTTLESPTESYETTTYSYTTEETTTPSYETTTQDLYKMSQDVYSAAQDLSTKANEISSMTSDISSKVSDINSMVSDLNSYDDEELSKKVQSVSKITQDISSKTSEISSLCSTTSSLASDISSASSDMTTAERTHRFRTTPWQKISRKSQDMITSTQSIISAGQDILVKIDSIVQLTSDMRVAEVVATNAYEVTSKTQMLISETLNIMTAVIELLSVVDT